MIPLNTLPKYGTNKVEGEGDHEGDDRAATSNLDAHNGGEWELGSSFAERIVGLLGIHSQSDIDSCRELLVALNEMTSLVRQEPPDISDFRILLDLVHDFLVVSDYAVRATLFRIFRHCITGPSFCKVYLELEYQWPTIISLERDHDYVMERKEALKVVHQMVLVCDPVDFPLSLARALSVIGAQSKEDLRPQALESLRCLALRNCELCAQVDGFHTLFDAVLERQTTVAADNQAEVILLTIIRLLNEPANREAMHAKTHLQRIMGAFTNLDTSPEDGRVRLMPSANALVTLLRSWAGVTLLTADDACLPTLMRLLMDDTVPTHVQEVIIEMIAEIFEPLVSQVPNPNAATSSSQRCYLPAEVVGALGDVDTPFGVHLGPEDRSRVSFEQSTTRRSSGSRPSGFSSFQEGTSSTEDVESSTVQTPKKKRFLQGLLRKSFDQKDPSVDLGVSMNSSNHDNVNSQELYDVLETRCRSLSSPNKQERRSSPGGSSPLSSPPRRPPSSSSISSIVPSPDSSAQAPVEAMETSAVPAVDPVYNLLDPYSAFICCAFIHVRLIDSLVHVGTHGEEVLSRKARFLLVDILRVISRIFPHSTCSELLVVPSLIEYTTINQQTGALSDRAHKAAAVLVDMTNAFALSGKKDMVVLDATDHTGAGVGSRSGRLSSRPDLVSQVELGDQRAAQVVDALGSYKRPGLGNKVYVDWARSKSTVYDICRAVLAIDSSGRVGEPAQGRRNLSDVATESVEAASVFTSSEVDAHSEIGDRNDLGYDLRIQLKEALLVSPNSAELASQMDASKVLTREGKDPVHWRWDVIHNCLAHSLSRPSAPNFSEALKTKFIKRLVSFLRLARPEDCVLSQTASTDMLGSTLACIEWNPNSLYIVQTAHLLLDLLVQYPAGQQFIKATWKDKRSLLWTDLDQAVAQLAAQDPQGSTAGPTPSLASSTKASAAKQASLSQSLGPHELLCSFTREYFLLTGLTLKAPGGLELLESLGVCPNILRNLISLGKSWRHDAVSRVALTSLAVGDAGIYSGLLLQMFTSPMHPKASGSITSTNRSSGDHESVSSSDAPLDGAGRPRRPNAPSADMQSYAATLQSCLVRSRPEDFLLSAFNTLVAQLSMPQTDGTMNYNPHLWAAINDACQSKLVLSRLIPRLLPLFADTTAAHPSPSSRLETDWRNRPLPYDWLVRTAGLRVGLSTLASHGLLEPMLRKWAITGCTGDSTGREQTSLSGCEEYVSTCDRLVSSSLRGVEGGGRSTLTHAHGKKRKSSYVAFLRRKSAGKRSALRRTREREGGAFRTGTGEDSLKGGRDRDRERAQPIPVFVDDHSPRMREGTNGPFVGRNRGMGDGDFGMTDPTAPVTGHPGLETGRDLLGLLTVPWGVVVTDDLQSQAGETRRGAPVMGRVSHPNAETLSSTKRFSYGGSSLPSNAPVSREEMSQNTVLDKSLSYIKVDVWLDLACQAPYSVEKNVVAVRARVMDSYGLPRRPEYAGFPVRSDKTLSASILLGICPLHRSGYIHPDPDKLAHLRWEHASKVEQAAQSLASGKQGKQGKTKKNLSSEWAQALGSSAVTGVEFQQDWIHCKPTHRQHCATELGDGLFAVEVPNSPVVWIFAREAPSHSDRGVPQGGPPGYPGEWFHTGGNGAGLSKGHTQYSGRSTGMRSTGLRPGTMIYLVEVRYLLRLEGGQPSFVPNPRHLYGELARSQDGLDMLRNHGVVRDLLITARALGSGAGSAPKGSHNIRALPTPTGISSATKDSRADAEAPPTMHMRRAAVLALGHIGAEDGGYELITQSDAGFLRWCTNTTTISPHLGLRATCFQALGLIGRSTLGLRAIQQLQWDCPSSPEAGPMAVPRNLVPLFHSRVLDGGHIGVGGSTREALNNTQREAQSANKPFVTIDDKGAVSVHVNFDKDPFSEIVKGPSCVEAQASSISAATSSSSSASASATTTAVTSSREQYGSFTTGMCTDSTDTPQPVIGKNSTTDSCVGSCAGNREGDVGEGSPAESPVELSAEALQAKRKSVVEYIATLPGYLHSRSSLKELQTMSKTTPRVFASRELYLTVQNILATHFYTLETRRDVLALFPIITHARNAEILLQSNFISAGALDELKAEEPTKYLYNYIHQSTGSLISPSSSQV